MPRRTKQQIAAENAAHRAYLQVFSNCAVPMLELPKLLAVGEAAALQGAPHGGVCTAMAIYADKHGYPHNDPADTLASVMERGMRS